MGIDIEKEVRVPRLILNLDDRELFAWVLTRAGNKPTASKPSHYKITSTFKIAKKLVKNIVAIVDVENIEMF
jgi:succinate dehydrogenase flavin-adding protein (antitoxin of CptAB toxin-antitoxin module)